MVHIEGDLPRWANRHLPRCAPPDSWRSLQLRAVPSYSLSGQVSQPPRRSHHDRISNERRDDRPQGRHPRLLELPLPPSPTWQVLDDIAASLAIHQEYLVTCWADNGLSGEEAKENILRIGERLAAVAVMLPEAAQQSPDDDDDEDELAAALEVPAEPDELDDDSPAESAAQLPEDRIGDLELLAEATLERFISNPYFSHGLRSTDEHAYFALAIAARLIAHAGVTAGAAGYGLNDRARDGFVRAERAIDQAEHDEIGFGPWEPVAAG
jgi:hypothetical protein